MPHREAGGSHNTPPPNGEERRQSYRREDDIETREIVDHAVAEAPIVTQLMRTSKVAGAIGLLCTLIGGLTGALGYRVLGPGSDIAALTAQVRLDRETERAAIDSLRRHDSLSDSVRQAKDFELNEKLNKIIETEKMQLRLSCAQATISARDKKIAGIDCQ
jgi:hypothetical protein